MAVRNDFTAGEVLAAADLNDTFASKLPYSFGTATPSTTDSGFLWYDSNSTPAAPKFWDGAAFQALTSGKILQIVRGTDVTQRTTTSTSLVDVTGMSVTISPTRSNSAVILIASFIAQATNGTVNDRRSQFAITDASNNGISGAATALIGHDRVARESGFNGINFSPLVLIGYSTPATTSAVTYKLRFCSFNVATTTTDVRNDQMAGQIYAIEVAA